MVNQVDGKGPFPAQILRKISLFFSFVYPGIRYRAIQFVLKILNVKPFDFIVPFFGLTYKGNTGNHIDSAVYYFGSYEGGILKKINEMIPPDSLIWDVGANVGQHTLFFSTFARKVISFEPYPRVLSTLKNRISENHIENVEVIEAGLSDKPDKLVYYEPPDSNLGIGSFISTHYASNNNSGLSLQVMTGDEFASKNGRAYMPQFIKIDVEGFELNVLKGLRSVLREQKPIVLFEYTTSHASVKDLLQQFPPGYQFQLVRNSGRNPISLASIEEAQSKPSGYIFATPN